MALARSADFVVAHATPDTPPGRAGASVANSRDSVDLLATDGTELGAWVSRCAAGDQEAFSALVEACADRLFNFLLRFAGNAHDAQDLAQETFLKVYRGIARFDTSRPFLPWLFTIARRTALNHLRRVRPTEELDESLSAGETADQALDALALRDDNERLWLLARRLKPKQYEALWLRYGEGLELAEVATVMRTNSIYVKVLLHRARSALLQQARRVGLLDPQINP